ncbi:hypothetical protein [Streptomyces sp. MJP52]|uniref:hypothetical protein n=1 Tax=Streptomyces sp. MJP52 TaxID=2940555 RepID=UPI0024750406|nr:hypothetical protein [Streptomyces sp. MJP52]MDH6226416.1 hypothetical protein [Streptomyces sp. MJP52]
MVSSAHEALHRIFRDHPDLFYRLSSRLGYDLPPPTKATVECPDVTETAAIERRIDTLIRFETESQGPFLLAVEAQGKPDPAKPSSWAYYVSYLWSKYRLPTHLMVVCQDRRTAAWAQRPVTSGLPFMPTLTVRPLVVGPHNTPVIADPRQAREDILMAALSAITHAAEPDIDAILKALSSALRDVPEDQGSQVVEYTSQGLRNGRVKQLWKELLMTDTSFYRSWLFEEVRDEGRAEGRAEESAKSKAEAILVVLGQRNLKVSDEVRKRIEDCGDPDVLRMWLVRAVTAPTAEGVFEDRSQSAAPDQSRVDSTSR